MRKLALAATLAVLIAPAARAQTAEVHVFTPGVVFNSGIKDLAESYTKETGVKVTVTSKGMAALNTLNNMSVVARSLGAWVAPEHCALNSNDVKAGLGDGDLRRLQAMVSSVVGMGRKVYS